MKQSDDRRKTKGSGLPLLPDWFRDKPKTVLSRKWRPSDDPTGWWMSEKLDGVPAYWTGETFHSPERKEYLAPDWFTEGMPKTALDGQLWIGRGTFQKTDSIVRRQDRGDAWKEVKFVIFDAPDFEGTFEERYTDFSATFPEGGHPYAIALLQQPCRDRNHLDEELARIEGLSGEGVMLRYGYSSVTVRLILWKAKPLHEGEAKVVGFGGSQGKPGEPLGWMELITQKGVRFTCSVGESDHERDGLLAIGSIVTYRFQELTDDGKPRFPTYRAKPADYEWPANGVVFDVKKT